MSGPVVVLVGLPGAGKTTVGGMVAETLGVAHRDTDRDITRLAGRSPSAVMAIDGPDRLSELEERAVLAALVDHAGVLSLGGRAIVRAPVRVALAAYVVGYLRVSVDSAVARITADSTRAGRLVSVVDLVDRVREAAHTRCPLYERVASFSVDTDDRAPAEVASEVCGNLAECA